MISSLLLLEGVLLSLQRPAESPLLCCPTLASESRSLVGAECLLPYIKKSWGHFMEVVCENAAPGYLCKEHKDMVMQPGGQINLDPSIPVVNISGILSVSNGAIGFYDTMLNCPFWCSSF